MVLFREGGRTSLSILIVFAVAVFFGISYGFQEQKQEIPSQEHEALVRLVLVDVIVTKDGKFAQDLTKEDFELFEDGKKVPINSWRRDIDKEIRISREKTVEELLSLINLGNEVMVCQMTGLKGFEILQPYTTEEAMIRKAVDMATGAVWHFGCGDSAAPPEEPGPEGIRSQGDPSSFSKAAQMEALFRDRFDFEKSIEALLTTITFIKDESGARYSSWISARPPWVKIC